MRGAPGLKLGPLAFALGAASLDGAAIYILERADGAYYTGITRRSVEERVSDYAQ